VRKRAQVRIGIIIIIICVKIENTDSKNSEGESYRCALHEYILLEWGNEEDSTRINF
jgi:hypothetical protein